jgi:hypothetical protein
MNSLCMYVYTRSRGGPHSALAPRPSLIYMNSVSKLIVRDVTRQELRMERYMYFPDGAVNTTITVILNKAK